MKLAAVVAHVEALAGIKRSRATIYNWAEKGVKAGGEYVKLQTETRAGQLFTKESWVAEFLSKIDQR